MGKWIELKNHLLSVDINGNDYFVREAISCTSPHVLIMEYNAKFAPPVLLPNLGKVL